MRINPNFILKTLYKTMTLTMPSMIYNPLSNTNLYIPIDIKPHSTYINFKLDDQQVNNLNSYIKQYNDSLEIVPIQLYKHGIADYYLSINIYNSTSPVFMTDKNIIRCELNTYVMDSHGTKGTLILDYMTNGISMDPISLFKKNEYLKKIVFEKTTTDIFTIFCNSNFDDIYLNLNYTRSDIYPKQLSHDLIEFTDNIFYKNGIMDKVYYDNTLLNPVLLGVTVKNVTFIYKNMIFDNIDSIFYFKDKLNFVGSMWDNLKF